MSSQLLSLLSEQISPLLYLLPVSPFYVFNDYSLGRLNSKLFDTLLCMKHMSLIDLIFLWMEYLINKYI